MLDFKHRINCSRRWKCCWLETGSLETGSLETELVGLASEQELRTRLGPSAASISTVDLGQVQQPAGQSTLLLFRLVGNPPRGVGPARLELQFAEPGRRNEPNSDNQSDASEIHTTASCGVTAYCNGHLLGWELLPSADVGERNLISAPLPHDQPRGLAGSKQFLALIVSPRVGVKTMQSAEVQASQVHVAVPRSANLCFES